MASKSVANSMLLLRILALAASTATMAVVITNNVQIIGGLRMRFKDIIAYRYVLSVAVIAAAYCIVQLPFSIYYAVQQKRMIRNGCLPYFDFYGDKVISLLLATGVGAGIAVSAELKRLNNISFDSLGVPKNDYTRATLNKYFDRGIIASSVLSVALICMAIVSIISSINRSRSRGVFG